MENSIATSIEQSKKLIELGIDINTADMHYQWYSETESALHVGKGSKKLNADCPAWSLSALLGLIKSEIYGENIYGDTVTYKVKFRKYKFTDDIDLYQIAYGGIKIDADGQYSFKDMVNTGEKENLIDAAFEMVVWLKENNKI